MNRKKKLYYLVTLALLLGGTALGWWRWRHPYGTFSQTATGLQYKMLRKGPGPGPQAGEVMLLSMRYTTAKGKVLFSTEEQGLPLAIPYTDELGQKKDGNLQEAIGMLQKGDRLLCKMSATSLFGENLAAVTAQYGFDKEADIFLHLTLDDTLPEAAFKKWEKEQLAMLQKKQEEQAEKQLQQDTKAITCHLKKSQLTAQTTPSGLQYVIDTPGQGALPKAGEKVKVNYTGRLLDGKIFDTNVEAVAKEAGIHDDDAKRTYEPIEFVLGQGQVIKGWDEGIMLLSKGAKARLWIPSPLAYGSQAMGTDIPANAILMFDVELVSIQQ